MELSSYLLGFPSDVTQSKSYWLFITQSTVLSADWLMLDNFEKAISHANTPLPALYHKWHNVMLLTSKRPWMVPRKLQSMNTPQSFLLPMRWSIQK